MLWLLMLALAPPEDAAHRADRSRTQALNRGAAAAVARRDARNGAGRDDYAQARARYERQMAEWRRRVAACETGDWRACD